MLLVASFLSLYKLLNLSEGRNFHFRRHGEGRICLHLLQKGQSSHQGMPSSCKYCVKQELNSVLDKASSSLEYSLRTFPSKRRRLCFIETSTSSCNHGSCLCWFELLALIYCDTKIHTSLFLKVWKVGLCYIQAMYNRYQGRSCWSCCLLLVAFCWFNL